MIELKNITKKYEDKLVLNDLSVSFIKGKLNIISGPSGCGKTTLLNIISGIDSSFAGELSGVPDMVGYLFQEDRLLPYYRVLDNVLFTIPDTIERNKRVRIALDNLKYMGLENEKNTFPHELSGGMSRRVAIARALSYPSELLLLDEPFSGLNVELKEIVVEVIMDNIQKNYKTAIIITHDLSVFENNNSVNIIKPFK